jgi:hypothetical protein
MPPTIMGPSTQNLVVYGDVPAGSGTAAAVVEAVVTATGSCVVIVVEVSCP